MTRNLSKLAYYVGFSFDCELLRFANKIALKLIIQYSNYKQFYLNSKGLDMSWEFIGLIVQP